MDEFALIRWIAGRTGGIGRPVVGIGDDCAVLDAPAGRELLVTTDMLMDGRHFVLSEAGPEAVGYKSLAVNLSDIAAMAGRPLAAFVAVALPRGGAVDVARGLVEGMAPLARRHGVALGGGDTNAWDGPLVVCVTIVGQAGDRGPLLRSGARPGDAIAVTGPLGGSLLGRHLAPKPRIDEALALHAAVALHASIDVSDGLAADLGHILERSGGLGATLDADAIPVHSDAFVMSRRDGRTPLEHALHDGEDFELCLTFDPADAAAIASNPDLGPLIRRIGTVDAEPGLRLLLADGSIRRLEPKGFNHLSVAPEP